MKAPAPRDRPDPLYRPNAVYALDPAQIRDLRPEVLGTDGRMQILPAAFWTATTAEERLLLGTRTGVYSFPTVELVNQLREIIDGRSAIEIGAGHGVLADALDIPGTDNMEQAEPGLRMYYQLRGQKPVTYGPNVVRMDAAGAVRHYRPQVVIGCWVTQGSDGKDWKPGFGKLHGVDEDDIITHCETYVFVGNREVHKDKRIWRLPHTVHTPPYVISKAINGSPDFIAAWNNPLRPTGVPA